MHFREFKYTSPDFKQLICENKLYIDEFEKSTSFEEQKRIFLQLNALNEEHNTMCSLAKLNFYLDTNNKYYFDELNKFNENNEDLSKLSNKLNNYLINSRFRCDFENHYGKQLFRIIESDLRTNSHLTSEDENRINHLENQYTCLMAEDIIIDGKKFSLDRITKLRESVNRNERKYYSKKYYEFYEAKSKNIEIIFDELVALRSNVAVKLGFSNYTDYSFEYFKRYDYDKSDILNLRKNIKTFVVPLFCKLIDKQKMRLSISDIHSYDLNIMFSEGNPEMCVGNGKFFVILLKMFKEISFETGRYFDLLLKNGLIDSEIKNNKAKAGFCMPLIKFKVPFIFANLTGSYDDARVIIHESGHAFHFLSLNEMELLEYKSATYEIMEIPSLTLELITLPWAHYIFGKDSEKYKLTAINTSLRVILQTTMYDEFQEFVYDNYNVDTRQRHEKWIELQKEYFPTVNYNEIDFLSKGKSWLLNQHFFSHPFYSIDYAIAQFCAYQFWQRFEADKNKTMVDYFNLCKTGGSKSFSEILKLASLKSPFDIGCIEELSKYLESWFEKNVLMK